MVGAFIPLILIDLRYGQYPAQNIPSAKVVLKFFPPALRLILFLSLEAVAHLGYLKSCTNFFFFKIR